MRTVLFFFLSFSFSAAFSLCRKRKSGKEEIRFLYAKYGFKSSSMAAARAASFASASASEAPRTPVSILRFGYVPEGRAMAQLPSANVQRSTLLLGRPVAAESL